MRVTVTLTEVPPDTVCELVRSLSRRQSVDVRRSADGGTFTVEGNYAADVDSGYTVGHLMEVAAEVVNPAVAGPF